MVANRREDSPEEDDQGLIASALTTDNEVGLELALDSLKNLRQLISEKGLDWERDRDALKWLFGPEKKGNPQVKTILEDVASKPVEPNPAVEQVRKYRELTSKDMDRGSGTDLPADAAKLMVSMLDELIGTYDSMLRRWMIRIENRNQLHATTALVPRQEVADRLQRYEGSLERSFDRTLSQLERLQRLRLGQPVLPALKVDVSH